MMIWYLIFFIKKIRSDITQRSLPNPTCIFLNQFGLSHFPKFTMMGNLVYTNKILIYATITYIFTTSKYTEQNGYMRLSIYLVSRNGLASHGTTKQKNSKFVNRSLNPKSAVKDYDLCGMPIRSSQYENSYRCYYQIWSNLVLL